MITTRRTMKQDNDSEQLNRERARNERKERLKKRLKLVQDLEIPPETSDDRILRMALSMTTFLRDYDCEYVYDKSTKSGEWNCDH